jgi:hypothetical protein
MQETDIPTVPSQKTFLSKTSQVIEKATTPRELPEPESATYPRDIRTGLEYEVPISSAATTSEIEGVQRKVIGHLRSGSRYKYLTQYGTDKGKGCSMKFESILPPGDNYDVNKGVDVVLSSNRIIEHILSYHRRSRLPLPMHILSEVKFISVYWDSKSGLGRAAEFDILNPAIPDCTSHTRCYIYLNPDLYKEYAENWGITNLGGFSHETKTSIRYCLSGKNTYERDLLLLNSAKEKEAKFERYYVQEYTTIPPELQPVPLVPRPQILARRTATQPNRYQGKVKTERSSDAARPWQHEETIPISTVSQGKPAIEGTEEAIERFRKTFCLNFGIPQGKLVADFNESQQTVFMASLQRYLDKRETDGGEN